MGSLENGDAHQQSAGTVLLVDDDPRFRAILQAFLELNGCTVVTAGAGDDALERIALDAPNVVLLDMRMPGMDGILTLKHLRMAHPHLPVICVTQDGEDGTREEALTLGANDYLLKPLNFEQLRAILFLKIFA